MLTPSLSTASRYLQPPQQRAGAGPVPLRLSARRSGAAWLPNLRSKSLEVEIMLRFCLNPTHVLRRPAPPGGVELDSWHAKPLPFPDQRRAADAWQRKHNSSCSFPGGSSQAVWHLLSHSLRDDLAAGVTNLAAATLE